MSTNYEITYSDGYLKFIVSPYSANGPLSPSSETFYTGAIKADTSLAIVGKGSDNYGERMQENMIHLLEHFSNEKEPSYPSGGQIWCDRSGIIPRLRVYNLKKHDNSSSIQSEVWIHGDQTSRFGTGGVTTLRLFNPNNFSKEDYKFTSVIYEQLANRTRFILSTPKGVRAGWYVGGWDDIITSSTGETDALLSRIINVNTNINYPKDAVNVETLNSKFEDTPIPLENLSDVEMGSKVNNNILYFDSSDSYWKNASISDVLVAEGDITFGGDLNLNGNTIYGFGSDMDMNYKKIVKVAYPDEYDPSSEFHAVNVGYFLKRMPGGGDNGISRLQHLSDVSNTLTPTSNDIFYFDGADWTNLSANAIGSILNFVPLSGTTAGKGSDPYYLDKDAMLHYNPSSDFIGDEPTIRSKIGPYGLITLGMGDTLWGEIDDTRVQHGSFDGTRNFVQLGWNQATPQNPIVPGKTAPDNADGVEFPFDIYSASHRALDPKQVISNGLYFEKSLSKIADNYPFVSLDSIVDIVNQSLGDLTSSPFRALYTGADFDSTPQIIPTNYIVGKSNLEIYVDGIKQYSSINNWRKSALEADASGSNGYLDYVIIGSYDGEGVDEQPSYLVVDGNETIRFNELQEVSQSFTVIDQNESLVETLTVNDEYGSEFDGGTETTIIYVNEDPDWGALDTTYSIRVDNEYNVGTKIWGGYPTGLDISNVYMFKITVDGNTIYPTIFGSDDLSVGDNPKNVAQVVDSINAWSLLNGEVFSVYLEAGDIYFFSGEQGNKDVDLEDTISTSGIFGSYSIIGVYDDPELPGVGMAFETSGLVAQTVFLPGIEMVVTNSTSALNDGTYIVKETETIGGVNTRVYVQDGIIPNIAPGGDMDVTPLPLFGNMYGGATTDRVHYYYSFTDPTTWNEKIDAHPNTTYNGNYKELGMVGFESNEIEWIDTPASGAKIEVIVRKSVD